eukprot:GEZU01014169.1.p1 GENE.GEZU01014169.1~~GEZU01014169.1.p1  ORF type:complete len:212 (-),score=47.65 GEZU01014169.1:457-1092(-)
MHAIAVPSKDSHDHDHDHDHDNKELGGEEQTLYRFIDTTKVVCLNEYQPGAGKNVFKPFDQRKDKSKYLESNEDEELILHIPFTVSVKIKNFVIMGGENGGAPSRVKLWVNRHDIDFSNCEEVVPTQELELNEDLRGELEYMTKVTKFQNVNSLTMYFPENFGSDTTRIYYIGFKGDFTNHKREVVHAIYEAKPQLKDHEVRADSFVPKHI